MTPEETRQFLDTLAPGELEQLIRESIISQEDQHEFKKRLAIFLESELADTTTKLSTTAQAVLDAANGACMYRPDPEDTRLAVAAALRAAIDQVIPPDEDHFIREIATRRRILAIAAELESSHD